MKRLLANLALPLLVAAPVAAQTASAPVTAQWVQAFGGSRRVTFSPEGLAAARNYGLLERAGMDAARAGDYADAAADLRRASEAHCLVFSSTFAELGTALDHLGKRDAAFVAYRKAFGAPVSPTLSIQHEGPDVVEALARYGTLCEDRGLRGDAVRCFDGTLPAGLGPLYGSLDAKTASPALVRALLGDVRGVALEDQARFGKERSAEALAAFGDGVRLAPGDARPYLFLADGLRHVGRFAEAEAAVRGVTRRDTSGALKTWAAESLKSIHTRQRG